MKYHLVPHDLYFWYISSMFHQFSIYIEGQFSTFQGYTGKKENLGNCEQVIFYFPRIILSPLGDEWCLANSWKKNKVHISSLRDRKKSLFLT